METAMKRPRAMYAQITVRLDEGLEAFVEDFARELTGKLPRGAAPISVGAAVRMLLEIAREHVDAQRMHASAASCDACDPAGGTNES